MNETKLFVEAVKDLKGILFDQASKDFENMKADDVLALIALSKTINSGLEMLVTRQEQLDRIESKLDRLLKRTEEKTTDFDPDKRV